MPQERDRPSVEQLLPLMLKQAKGHAIVFLGLDGNIIGWSAGAEHVFGYQSDEVNGKHVSLLFPPEDREHGVPSFELEVATVDGTMEDDRWMLRKDRTRVWVSGAVNALRDASGAILGFAKIMRNRSDFKGQLETAEKRVVALTHADDRHKQFLGILAHELRNPLSPLVSASELLRKSLPRDSDLQEIVRIISRQVGFLRKIVEELLDVTRIEQGKVHLSREIIRMVDILQSAAETCRPLLEEQRHEFKMLHPPTSILVSGDPTRLQQVFVNLITNAAKYTPEGGHVWVKANLEGAEAVVDVEDNGIGISSDMLPRIFDLFTQEDRPERHEASGLGIGLALVKDLVGLHGGSVQVRSDGKGKGSTFTVRLPLATSDKKKEGTNEPDGSLDSGSS